MNAIDNNNITVAIGSSTGGPRALTTIISQLPGDFPAVLITQHMAPNFIKIFADQLDNSSKLKVKEAKTGDIIAQGQVLIAPGERQMRVAKKMGNIFQVICEDKTPVNGHCPSVDVLFESVAKNIGNRAIGVILTGMGSDGAKALLAMRKAGSRTIGQDQASCVVYGMPKAAFEIGAVEEQCPLDQMITRMKKYVYDMKR